MIASVIPYVNSKNGYSEELFHFLHFLSLFLALRYFRFGSTTTLFGLTATLFALCLVRPVPAFYFWIFIVVAGAVAIAQKRSLRPLVAAAVVYAVAMGSWALMSRSAGNAFFSPDLPLQTTAQKRAAEVYFGGPLHPLDQKPRQFAIDPDHGPASRELYTVLVDHIKKTALQWQTAPSAERPARLFADPSHDPEAMAATVLSTPIFSYFDLIREAAHAELGEAAGEQLLYSVAQEYGTAGFSGAMRYILKNPIRLAVGGSPPMGNRNFFGLFLLTRLRYSLGRFYTLETGDDPTEADLKRWEQYSVHPTPQGLRDFLTSVDPLRGVDIVSEDNGPASRELLQGLRLFMAAYPSYWQSENAWLAQYKDNPEAVVTEIFRSPLPGETGMYEGFLYEATTAFFGYAQADRIYNQAAWETLRRYPFSAAIIWDNFLRATLITPFGNVKSQLKAPPYTLWAPDMLFVTRANDFTSLTPGLAQELVPEMKINAALRLFGEGYAIFHLVAFAFVFAAMFMLIPALCSPARPFVIFLTLAYLYDVAVVSVYANLGAQRYYDVFIFLPVLITLIGCAEQPRMFSRRYPATPRSGSW
jgi:hypothetical protein